MKNTKLLLFALAFFFISMSMFAQYSSASFTVDDVEIPFGQSSVLNLLYISYSGTSSTSGFDWISYDGNYIYTGYGNPATVLFTVNSLGLQTITSRYIVETVSSWPDATFNVTQGTATITVGSSGVSGVPILIDGQQVSSKEFTSVTTATLSAPNKFKAPDDDIYEFVRWSDGNIFLNRTINVTGNATYTAIYTNN